jgi:inward rectifier potassium channel
MIRAQNGKFFVPGQGIWYSYWRDPYHLLLAIPWVGFVGAIALLYLSINILFALAYLAGGDSIANAHPGSFLDAFFFSVQTFASIGYGAMYPQTRYANSCVTLEALVSLVSIAVLTGLAFARFSHPTTRVMFSQVAVVTPHDGVPTLIFRAANQRHNHILEAQLRVYLIREEVTAEGKFALKIHDLELVRSQSPSFIATWLVLHPIQESSPLYGRTGESLLTTKTIITVSLSGIDETLAQVVHARHVYTAEEILWDQQFVDIIHHTSDGQRYIDYTYFHEVESK